MNFPISCNWRPLAALLLSATVLAACNDNGSKVEPVVPPLTDTTYSADIVWTEYGIPHVVAQDWGGLGYGIGNAFAQQNFCPYMKDVVRANGQSAELLGDDGDLAFDFVMKLYNTDEALARVKAQMSARGLALFEGLCGGYFPLPGGYRC